MTTRRPNSLIPGMLSPVPRPLRKRQAQSPQDYESDSYLEQALAIVLAFLEDDFTINTGRVPISEKDRNDPYLAKLVKVGIIEEPDTHIKLTPHGVSLLESWLKDI